MNWSAYIAWWFSIITGVSHTVAFDLPPGETLRVLVYESGRPISECSLLPGTEQMKLAAWLRQNSEGWKGTAVSYAPGVLVSGRQFSINFMKAAVILNYDEGQYARTRKPSEYEFVFCQSHTQPGAAADAAASPSPG